VDVAAPKIRPRIQVHRRVNLHAAVLRYLTEIVRLGSIRRAAATLNVASSAINRQVLRLERELGARVFDRLPTGMRLTSAGELLLQHVRGTLRDFDQMLAEVDGLSGILSGHVRLAAVDSLLVGIVPSALEDVARQFPVVTYAVTAAAPDAVLSVVAAGECEIGLTFVAKTSLPLQLVASVRAPLGVVMTPDHPLARRKVLSFADLASHPIAFQTSPLPPGLAEDDEYTAFRNRSAARFTSNSIEFDRSILRSGLAVACFTRLGFQRELAAADLVWVPLASSELSALEIGLFIPLRRALTPAASLVVRTLTRHLAQIETLP
jgi:DNA-binding transcriptional LysR family regulator